ncbi:MAG: N-(5'-phosphoribosyl)anthranilate isomerase [Pseudomonadota bacterium]
MFEPMSPFAAQRWIDAIFTSQAAQQGKVVRRKLSDIERYAGYDVFKGEIARRGYTAVRNGDTIVIFCNREPIHRIV